MEQIANRFIGKALAKMKIIKEYQPIFKLINSLEKDVIDSCINKIKPFIKLQKTELSKIKSEEEIPSIRVSIQ